MRNAPGKTTGEMLVPLSVKQAQGESLDAVVVRAEFDEVWAELQAMQEQDEVLDDIRVQSRNSSVSPKLRSR